MKKIIYLVLMCILTAFLLCACGSAPSSDDGKISVVCTAFPQYDWAKNIINNSKNVNLVLLNTKGTDMHSYEPSAKDIITIGESDILIVIGGEADKWALDAVSEDGDTTVINLLEIAETDEHFGELPEHDHTESCDHSHEDSHESADEHIWMSIKKAAVFTERITDAICEKDADNETLYRSNSSNYVNRLSQLDAAFEETVSASDKSVMVVADRFPFVYLANDYGIECFAAFPGCSADTDATPDTIIKLSKALDEHDLSFVAVTENTNGKTARAVIDNTADKNQTPVVINSMQSVSLKDAENGTTYIGIMEQNLEAIKTLLEIK